MKVYFDRTEPYYYVREPTFDGIAVEIPEDIMTMLDERKTTLALMEAAIEDASAPEDSAVDLSAYFVNLLTHEIALTIVKDIKKEESNDGEE